MTHSTPDVRRISAWFMEILRNPIEFLKTLKIVAWAEKSIILIVMQNCDSSFQMRLKRSCWCPWKKSYSLSANVFLPSSNRQTDLPKKWPNVFKGNRWLPWQKFFSMFPPQPTFWEDQSWERAFLREWLINRTEFFITRICMSAMAAWLEPTWE